MTKIKSPDYEDTPQAPDFSKEEQPLALFERWMKEAAASEPQRSKCHGARDR